MGGGGGGVHVIFAFLWFELFAIIVIVIFHLCVSKWVHV